MAHSQPNELSPEFLRHELYSESTLPLLSYLIRNVHARETDSDQTATDIFHEVKRGIGLDDRPIPDVPDESEQVEPAMLLLMKEGPSGNGTKIQGAPKVSDMRGPDLHTNSLTNLGYDRGCRYLWALRWIRAQEGRL